MSDCPVVAVFTAVTVEREAIRRALGPGAIDGRTVRGRLGRIEWVLQQTGVGPARAEACARLFLAAAAPKPAAVLCAGLSGGLTPTLSVGDLAVAGELVTPDRPVPRPCDPALVAAAGALIGRHGPGPVEPVRLATTATMVGAPTAKAELARSTGAAMVDMESAAVAAVAAEYGVPFLAVRAISDGLDDVLDPELAGLVDEYGDPRLLRAAWHVICRPTRLPSLLRLKRRCDLAAGRLGEFLADFVPTAADSGRV
jgi:adenosylhomocysteine nucleosidase